MDNASARALTLDEYADLMLREGRYDVDPETGRVWNARTGQTLALIGKRRGYLAVNLAFSGPVVRQVKVHRLVAIKVHGTAATKDKQVGHLDGITSHNAISNLWLPATAREHVERDGTNRNLRPGQPRTSWPPCVRCGDPDGAVGRGQKTPVRITGRRFGIDGDLCRRCYGTLGMRVRKARLRAA